MAAIGYRQLNPELFQFLEARQNNLKILKTTTTPAGQMLDWVPIETQHPEGKVPSPPPTVSLAVRSANEEKPVSAARNAGSSGRPARPAARTASAAQRARCAGLRSRPVSAVAPCRWGPLNASASQDASRCGASGGRSANAGASRSSEEIGRAHV